MDNHNIDDREQDNYGQNPIELGYNVGGKGGNNGSDYASSRYAAASNYTDSVSQIMYTNTFGVLSLVFGITSVIFFVFNIVNVIVGILAIIFGTSQIRKAKMCNKKSYAAVAGVWSGVVGIVFSIVFLGLLIAGLERSGIIDAVQRETEQRLELNNDNKSEGEDIFDWDLFIDQN